MKLEHHNPNGIIKSVYDSNVNSTSYKNNDVGESIPSSLSDKKNKIIDDIANEELPRFATDEEVGFVDNSQQPADKIDKPKHQYTIELLYHFNCGSCQQWWSYAATPSQPIIDRNTKALQGDKLWLGDEVELYCPHCGHDNFIEIKEGFLELLMPDEKINLSEEERVKMLLDSQPSLFGY